MSDSLWPHGLQPAKLLCPPLAPRVCSNSPPLSRCCYLTISSSITPLFFCLQSSPASGSFPVSQIFSSGSQRIRASASAPVFPMNIQGWFPLGLTDLISLLSKELSRVFSSTTVSNCNWIRWVGHRVCLVMEKWLNLNIKDSMKTHIIETYHWFSSW